MAGKDYYEILGVSKDASAQDIKRAFRKKARELHPDVNKAADAEERFKEVNEAYDVLSDDKKRAHYDQFGTMDNMGGFGGSYEYVNMNDIFGGMNMNDIFSTFFGGAGAAQQVRRQDGRDMSVGVRISLEEAATGVKKDVIYDRLAPCDACGGTGAAEGSETITCPTCQGRGTVTTVQRTFLGDMQSTHVCPDCQGMGKKVDKPCPECDGQGRVPDREHVTVEIPAGIHDGQQLRVTGFGEAGIRGAHSGDLYVQVRIQPHEYFQRHRDDIHVRASISIAQAALGDEITVKGILPDEMVTVIVPPGCQDDQVIKVKKVGMPRFRDNENRGDLHVHMDVVVPTSLTSRQRELLEELAETLGDEIEDTRSPWQKIKDAFN